VPLKVRWRDRNIVKDPAATWLPVTAPAASWLVPSGTVGDLAGAYRAIGELIASAQRRSRSGCYVPSCQQAGWYPRHRGELAGAYRAVGELIGTRRRGGMPGDGYVPVRVAGCAGGGAGVGQPGSSPAAACRDHLEGTKGRTAGSPSSREAAMSSESTTAGRASGLGRCR